jgi:hypothetical protein
LVLLDRVSRVIGVNGRYFILLPSQDDIVHSDGPVVSPIYARSFGDMLLTVSGRAWGLAPEIFSLRRPEILRRAQTHKIFGRHSQHQTAGTKSRLKRKLPILIQTLLRPYRTFSCH